MNRQFADPRQPWNPREPINITPEEFEKQVLDWVTASLRLSPASITHQARVRGQGGQYAIDIRIGLTVLEGARLDLLVECKHQSRPVERDEVILLEGKLRDTRAHKGFVILHFWVPKGRDRLRSCTWDRCGNGY